jgi:hypothetical protein
VLVSGPRPEQSKLEMTGALHVTRLHGRSSWQPLSLFNAVPGWAVLTFVALPVVLAVVVPGLTARADASAAASYDDQGGSSVGMRRLRQAWFRQMGQAMSDSLLEAPYSKPLALDTPSTSSDLPQEEKQTLLAIRSQLGYPTALHSWTDAGHRFCSAGGAGGGIVTCGQILSGGAAVVALDLAPLAGLSQQPGAAWLPPAVTALAALTELRLGPPTGGTSGQHSPPPLVSPILRSALPNLVAFYVCGLPMDPIVLWTHNANNLWAYCHGYDSVVPNSVPPTPAPACSTPPSASETAPTVSGLHPSHSCELWAVSCLAIAGSMQNFAAGVTAGRGLCLEGRKRQHSLPRHAQQVEPATCQFVI